MHTRHLSLGMLLPGLVIGALIGAGAVTAATTPAEPPTEHKGLAVEALGLISPQSMETTIGLTGHKLQLRAITIMPGGQIAKHSHANRPGLVKVVSGEWIEGRESGETVYAAEDSVGIIEDEDTVHWFFNRGERPATAIVCDVTPVE
ncbi:MAG: cupin domain-containing protein [Paracoccaceae bacterium]